MDRFLAQAHLYTRFVDDWTFKGFFTRLSNALNHYIDDAKRTETKMNRKKIAVQVINFFTKHKDELRKYENALLSGSNTKGSHASDRKAF